MKNIYQQAEFLLSVAKLEQLPEDEGYEVAFLGRSNAGKSSVLNKLTGIGGLARVSKTPGRTQLINYFGLDDSRRLVDLPGYGFAKVPIKMKHHWEQLIDQYLQVRQSLQGLILVMDIRHPLRDFDKEILLWCVGSELPVHILLNKVDKLSNSEIKKTLIELDKSLSQFGALVSYQTFSALKGQGIDELKATMNQWLAV